MSLKNGLTQHHNVSAVNLIRKEAKEIVNHRIIESFRMENSFKIIEYNH